jgi:metal-responsive CopG/Arc/MetJ family transcriptional regulator
MERQESVPEEGWKKTSIDIPANLWREMRHLSLDKGKTASQLIAEAVQIYLELNRQLQGHSRPLVEVVREAVSQYKEKEVRKK